MAKKKTPETLIKNAAKELLSLYRIWTFPVLQGMGAHPGIADRLGIYKGKPLAIEFKSPKGRMSPNQAYFRLQWELEGGLYIECRTLEDLTKALGIKTLGMI